MRSATPPDEACAHRRIRALVTLVPAGSVVAEIGTDRGLVARWLVTSGRAARCIATERSPERLARAFGLPAADPRAARLELRSGDGLAPLTSGDGVEVVVLAGLGGATIGRILDPGRLAGLGVRRLVVDPRTELRGVRARLAELGFGIAEELVVEERGRYFTLVAADAGSAGVAPPDGVSADDALEAGPVLLARRDSGARAYWRSELRRLDAVLAVAPRGPGRRAASERRETAIRILSALGPGTDAGAVTFQRGGRTRPSGYR